LDINRTETGRLLLLPLGALVCLVLAGPSPAQASNERPDLTSISLEELAQTKVTSVSKTEEPQFRTPAAIQVVTAEDIRRAGATSIPEALRLVPGVHVARINSSQWGIGIRGFTNRLSRSQLALMDGRSLYTPLFAGIYWEVQDTLLEDIERIEVVRGPGGTLWGANAVNGIVNIITKDAKDTQGLLLSAGGGNEERAFVNARYGGKAGESGHYRVYAKYFKRDAAYHPDGDDFDDWHLAQGGFRTDWKLSGADRLTVQGDLYSGRTGERTTLSYYEVPYLRIVEGDGQLSGGNLTARWDHPAERSALTVLAYYDRTRRVEPNFHETRDTFDLDLQYRTSLGDRNTLVGGLGYRASAGRTAAVETVAFVPADRTDHIFSAFLLDEIGLVKDRLRLSLGTKLERNQYTGFELQPSGRLLWAPRPRQALWAAVTRAVRTPSRLERDLFLTAALSPVNPVFYRIEGNHDFISEKTLAYEAGYRVQPADRLSLQLALFHSRYRDLLSLERGQPFLKDGRQTLPLVLANQLRGRSSGAELTAVAHLSPRWVVQGGYSYLSLDLEAGPGSTDATSAAGSEGASPRHAARLQSSWMLPHDVDVDVSLRWVDHLPAQKVPAYTALDARVSWQVVPRLEIAVVGQDLLHARHLEFGGTDPIEIQRSIYGEARLRW
jgi:iron complex outermembrane recepter protein